MRRLPLLAMLLALHASPVALAPQTRPPQADGVVRLLSDLEGALLSGSLDEFRGLAAAALPEGDLLRFRRAIAPGPAASAAVRERARRPVEDDGFEILAEVLIGHGRRGRIATWRLEVEPDPETPGRFALTALDELASVDGLIRLLLDTTRQFAIHDFTFEAPDLRLRMSSGSAFLAESPGGVTALVLRGRGRVEFTPPDPAEQGQLRLFAGDPEYVTDVESVFIRLNPGEFPSRVAESSLVPAPLDPSEARRAQDIFDDLSPRTYNVNLNDLGSERWSLEPAFGSLVVELRSRRHGWLTYARSPNLPEDVSFFDRDDHRNISVYASEEKLALRGPDYSEDDASGYDIERYEIDLSFDPVRSWVSGHASVQVRVLREQTSTLTLRLAEELTISSLSSVELGHLLTLRVIGQDNVIVTLPRPASRGDTLTFDFTYSGRLDPQGLDREALAVGGQVPVTQETERTILLPEARYLYSNRVFWYPQGEHSDYATARMRLAVPSEYQVVASGSFAGSSMSEVHDEARGETMFRRTVEYVTDRPARYLSCVISRFVPIDQAAVPVPAVAPPAVGEATGPLDSVNVEVVSTPRMTGRNRDMPQRVAGIVDFYASTIGGAPYPDFTLAGIDDNLPGGHSPAYFAVLHQPLPTTPYLWSSDPVAFDHIYDDFFLAHEVAHQWWGQAIGWKNYHEQWLSEGLSQYFAVLYAGHERGQPMLERLLEQMRRSAAPLTRQGPISLGYRLGHIQNESRVFRAIVYNKSAVVLHMLRRLIGDEAFFPALQDFYREFRFRKAGTLDLQTAFEARAGRSLGRFFELWIRRAELPDLDVDTRVDNDRGVAVVRVRQRGEVFDMPLRFEIEYEDRGRVPVELVLSRADEEFTIPLEGRARRIEVKDELVLGRIRG
jgi:hypothetical protein